MDGDLFGDALVDDLLNFTRESSGDFDTSDLMDILEPDHLENNILLDDGGSLDHMPDVAALDDLDTLAMAPETPAEDTDAATDSSDQAAAAPSLDTALDDIGSDADDEQDEEDYDPLEALTSSMLPEDDLEALARLAAGEDIAGSSTQTGSTASASPQDDTAATHPDALHATEDDLAASLEVTDFDGMDLGISNLDDTELDDTDLSPAFSDNAFTDNAFTDNASAVKPVGKNIFQDTLDERLQPNAQELEELAMLASGLAENSGEDLGSLISLPEDEGAKDEQDTIKASTETTSTESKPRKDSASRANRAENDQTTSRQPPSKISQAPSEPSSEEYNSAHEQARGRSQGIRQFSQFASTWQSQTALVPSETSSEQAHLATEATYSQSSYRPPNQLQRHFNASFMLEAADRLKDVLDIPDIPIVVFLGRAAERCLGRLDGHDVVSVAQLAGSSFVPSFQVPQQESFRRVLMAKRQADAHQTAPDPHMNPSSDASERPLLVADISELELDGLNTFLEGSHLLLTRLQTDPAHQHLRGTLTLIGDIDLQAGALFLKAVKDALESPITLMV
ncbi:MAG: hypothetical protein AAF267_04250 [Deinococcota bacterium]